jgi:hypothetical protein
VFILCIINAIKVVSGLDSNEGATPSRNTSVEPTTLLQL